ncbi:hypothetical protein [Bordetella ansorpii]|uniref:hypothetical protein n=1 Tax=Bordetella ansorpii TaxID=288768 RepID=UPI0012E741D2|nr:hypothetical protein [Bordetella ansorpii]
MSTKLARLTVLVLGVVLAPLTVAQTPTAARSATQEPAACIEVQVGSARSVSYDCLAQRMSPPEKKPGHPDMPNPALASERVTRLPPTQTGLFTSLHQMLISGVKRDK